jgi:hypothetical protein
MTELAEVERQVERYDYLQLVDPYAEKDVDRETTSGCRMQRSGKLCTSRRLVQEMSGIFRHAKYFCDMSTPGRQSLDVHNSING